MVTTFNLIADKHQGDRDEQQDAYFIEVSRDKQRLLCVIADGMGGHRGGRQASKCIVNAAQAVWQKTAEGSQQAPKDMLESIIQHAYDAMRTYEARENISPRSTCVILFITENKAHYCHIGDSRLYHFRKQKLLTRTKDHSVVQMLVEMGKVSEASMGTHEDQGRLLKWIGGKESPQATFHSVEIEAGDQFLLCSDGLWEYVPVEHMEEAWQSKRHIKHIIKSFIHQARHKSHGKGDNIAVILCEIPENENTPPFNWFLWAVGMGVLITIGLVLGILLF